MGCLDPEFPETTKPIDIDQEKHLGRRSVWKLQSVVMEEMDLDELTQTVVKGKGKAQDWNTAGNHTYKREGISAAIETGKGQPGDRRETGKAVFPKFKEEKF